MNVLLTRINLNSIHGAEEEKKKREKKKTAEYAHDFFLLIHIFFYPVISPKIHHYFNDIFHEFKILKKVITTETFYVDFHYTFNKFWIILFFQLFFILSDLRSYLRPYIYIYIYIYICMYKFACVCVCVFYFMYEPILWGINMCIHCIPYLSKQNFFFFSFSRFSNVVWPKMTDIGELGRIEITFHIYTNMIAYVHW